MEKVRVCFFSDNHGDFSLDVPDADILICCGDSTFSGTGWDLDKFTHWYSSLPHKEKIFIAGNHDFCLESYLCKKLIPKELIYLENELYISKAGLRIYGSPNTPRFGYWAFMKERGDDIAYTWKKIPKNLDILITHGPAYGILDKTPSGVNAGCYDLLLEIKKKIPRYHSFGHIHHGYGIKKTKKTTFINCSVYSEEYELENKPVVVDIEVRK